MKVTDDNGEVIGFVCTNEEMMLGSCHPPPGQTLVELEFLQQRIDHLYKVIHCTFGLAMSSAILAFGLLLKLAFWS